MPFPKAVRIEALIACQRHCCLCHERKHVQIQCHHITAEADGGPDTFDNCIPLCPDCHATVRAYDPRHGFGGTPYDAKELIRRRDDWYAVIRRRTEELSTVLLRSPKAYPHNSSLRSTAAFNYADHDGFYRLGEGNSEFLTRWSKASDKSIYTYRDGTNVEVALAPKAASLKDINDASTMNYSSRVRTVNLGQIVVFENHVSRYCAALIRRLQDDTRGSPQDWIEFDYWILDDGTDDFSPFA